MYIIAICEYCDTNDPAYHILSFQAGQTAILLKRTEDDGWWGVKIGKKKGWVPAAYWQVMKVLEK